MVYKAGWLSTTEARLPLFTTIEEVVRAYPEIFFVDGPLDSDGEVTSVPPTTPTEQWMLDKVEMVNSEGNYHDFLFRPAFGFEVTALYQES